MAIQELLKLSKDYYLDRAPKEIEQNRKGTFFITLTHKGQAVDDAEISFRLKRHDYDFGCNIFMLDQYESAKTNEQYPQPGFFTKEAKFQAKYRYPR